MKWMIWAQPPFSDVFGNLDLDRTRGNGWVDMVDEQRCQFVVGKLIINEYLRSQVLRMRI
jgi:hypothetical protein